MAKDNTLIADENTWAGNELLDLLLIFATKRAASGITVFTLRDTHAPQGLTQLPALWAPFFHGAQRLLRGVERRR